MSKNENLKYQLETLASYEKEDLDNPEFEVAYESEQGCDVFATVCCIDVGARSLDRINELEDLLTKASEELNEFKNPKNWTRPYNYKGELINEHALYRLKLAI